MNNFQKMTAAVAIALTAGLPSISTAQSLEQLIKDRKGTKSQWEKLAIAGGALAILGQFSKDKTLSYVGAGSALYSLYRMNEDSKSKNKLERQRAELFRRTSFLQNGVRYNRVTVWKNGKKHYRFVKAKR